MRENPYLIKMLLTIGPAAALMFFVPLWGPRVALWRLCETAAAPEKPRRFGLADGMILMALISMATAFSTSQSLDGESSQNWLAIVSVNALAILMWYRCIKFMDKNHIFENSSRMVIQLFVYPSAVLSISYLLILVLALLSGLIDYFNPGTKNPPEIYLLVIASALFGSLVWIILTRIAFLAILNRNAAKATGSN